MARIDEYQENRKKNFNYLIENNIEPYPYRFDQKSNSKEILKKYQDLENGEETKDQTSVAGRVLLVRNLGKIAFLDLHDRDGKIQIVVKKDEFKEKFKLIKKLDKGDIIGVNGNIFKTKRGEISIDAKDITFLSKCFLPLPEKWHGLQDPETKYRKRYLDLLLNKDVRDTFIIRSKITKIIREILDKKDFIEVETPLLQPLYGGANARPFVTQSNVLKQNLYLSISPELYLKRLLVGGFERIYTICKNFRNEGIDKTHNPEFTQVEIYSAYKDYNDAIDLIEEIYETIALRLFNTTKIEYLEKTIDFKRPWKKLTMKQALIEFQNLDVDKLNDQELKELLEKNKIELDSYKRGLAIAELFEFYCEDKLIGPIHIIDHPKETTPLCKLHRVDKSLIERNEPYVNGVEAANSYSELNDPYIQEELMNDQKDQGRAKGENHPIDTDFIESLKYGMPPAFGIGLGIDRLTMIFTNKSTIKDVILFPLLKEESKEENVKENDK